MRVLRDQLSKGKRAADAPQPEAGFNPWAFAKTYETVDATGRLPDLADAFHTFGVLKVRNVLSPDDAGRFLEAVRRISGVADADCLHILRGEKKPFASPGTVARHEDLWPLVWHERLLTVVHATLGPDARFFGRDSLGVHFSSRNFHKDTKVSDQVLGGAGYPADFSTVRVIFYLNDPGRPATRFGFKPFSHRQPRPGPPEWLTYDESQLEESVVWLDLDPTDCVMFDARMTHSGDEIDGPKYMVVLTYDLETPLALDVFHRTCTSRAGEGYGYDDFSPEFLQSLARHNLLISGLDDPARFAETMAAASPQHHS